jgi:hypothetical protein
MVGTLRALIVCVIAAGVAADARQKPQIADVLAAAHAYLLEYSQKIAVAAQEEYVQRDVTTSSAPRKLVSDVVMVGIGNGVVIGYRDIHSVDASSVRSRDERLLKLFRGPNPAAVQDGAKALEDEHAHYYLTPNLRTLDAPGLALEFLRGARQPQSQFAIENVRTVDGAQVATVKFTERSDSKILPTPEGSKTSGKFWIEVSTGAVRQTELTVDHRELFRFHISTKYAYDAATGFWVPSEVLQDVEVRTPTKNAHSVMGADGQLGARQHFEGRAKYTAYRRISDQ